MPQTECLTREEEEEEAKDVEHLGLHVTFCSRCDDWLQPDKVRRSPGMNAWIISKNEQGFSIYKRRIQYSFYHI